MKTYKDNKISNDITLQTNKKLECYSDEEILKKYRLNNEEQYLAELLCRHNSMMKNIAGKFFEKNSHISSYEDYLQNAYLGAIIAYNRFSSEKSNSAKLSTFVYTTVYRYLQTCLDEQGNVKCPSGLREVRSYFAGKYDLDSEKKTNFEKKYEIFDEQSRHSVFTKFSLLKTDAVTNFVNFEQDDQEENYIEHNIANDFINPDSIINSAAINITIESLTDIQKEVLRLKYIQNQSIKEVAENLSAKFGNQYTTSMIYNEMNEIKEAFAAFA